MKKLSFLALVLSVMLSVVFSSCEDNRFAEMSELIGSQMPDSIVVNDTITQIDSVLIHDTTYVEKVIVEHDTINIYIHDTTYIETVVTDTIVVEITDTVYVNGEPIIETIYDTVYVTRELEFDCYGFNREGYIVAKSSEGKEYVVSYNVVIETSGDVNFQSENEDAFVLKNKSAYFDSGNMAYFNVSKGNESVTLGVHVNGTNSVIINNQEVTPCYNFGIEAELTNLSDEERDGKTYQVAVVNYSFLNGDGEVVKRAQQYLYAPKHVEEPVNERTVTINYTIEDAQSFVGSYLVVTGTIDNTLFADTTAQVRIPLTLGIECGDPKTVYGNNFEFNMGTSVVEVSKNAVQSGLKEEANSLVITYSEYETIYNHTSTASGKSVVTQQTVSHNNDFVVEFGGATKNITLPVKVMAKTSQAGDVVTEGQVAKVKVDITYEATMENLTASDVQEVNICVNAIYFENQTILKVNRTVTFDAIQSPRVYDCALTQDVNNSSAHNFYYREIVGGVAKAWQVVSLSADQYKYISDGLKQSGSALAIYFHKNVDGPKVGYLRDYISTAKQVIYFAYGYTASTVDNVNFAMFGKLDSSILGSGVAEGCLLKMVCKEGVYNNSTISPAETIYFVK